MTRGLLFLACLLAAGSPALAQPGPPPGRIAPPQGEGGRAVSFEALVVPDTGQATMRVDVAYRIDESFFISVTDPDPAAAAPFIRKGELLLELVDSTGLTQARAIRTHRRPAASLEREPAGRAWITGLETMRVPPGAYRIGIEVSDLESQRRFSDRSRTVQASARRAGLALAGRTWFGPGTNRRRLVLQNYGGDIRFGTRGGLALLLTGVPEDTLPPRVRYELTPVSEGRTVEPPVPPAPPDRTAGDVLFLRGAALLPGAAGDTVSYTVLPDAGPSDVALLYVPLPLEIQQRRTFLVRAMVSVGPDSLPVEAAFRPLWPDMPISLRDPEFALDALRHVTTRERLDSLRSVTPEGRARVLEQFWLPRDPTPGTAMNEVMTEYYRRVDRAITEFATLREPDGSRTDRGRIFILHGQPTRRDRTLGGAEGNREIWTYEGIRKRFVFVDEMRTGWYTLVSTQSIAP
jgi:GWxTD domain-containing protein